MKNSKILLEEVMARITLQESADEVRSIALILLDHVLGISRTDVVAGKMVSVTTPMSNKLAKLVDQVNRNEPIQYVVGEAFFYGRVFKVDTSVLIPRPETEELVRRVLDWSGRSPSGAEYRVLDIGTGSGCIPVTLALELKKAEVFALDISVDALALAKKNADLHGARVKFIQQDILTDTLTLADLDVVVSNPPYVLAEEKGSMKSNVRDYEPHLALFVPDTDPLVFYRRIVSQATTALKENGLLAVEINERFAAEVLELFVTSGFNEARVEKDISGKDRIVSGIKTFT